MTPQVWIALIGGVVTVIGGFFATVRWGIREWRRGRREEAAIAASGQKAVADEIFEMRVMLAAQIEQGRRRDARERRKRESSDPPPARSRQAPHAIPIVRTGGGDFAVEESTDIVELMEQQRQALTPTRSTVRPPRPGTHHDKER